MVAEVAVDAHGEGAAVFVAQPAADGGDVDAGFDAGGGKEMPKVVVGDAVDAQLLAPAIHGLLAFLDLHHGGGGRFLSPLGAQTLQEGDHGGVHGDPAHFAVLGAELRIAGHVDATFAEVAVGPADELSLAFAESAVSQELDEVGAVAAETPPAFCDGADQGRELFEAGETGLRVGSASTRARSRSAAC